MKKIKFHPTYLQVFYFIITFILFSIIVYTPTFIQGPVHISKRLVIEEDTIEGILVGILFLVSILIQYLYKAEVNRHKNQLTKTVLDKKKIEKRLQVSDQYIGRINVQMQDLKSKFNSIDDYPKSKSDFRKTLTYYGERLLGIVKSDWVLLRIINSNNQRTISEHFETRLKQDPTYPRVSNKMIIEKKPIEKLTPVTYDPTNLEILVFCIMPVDKITEDERTIILSVLDELTRLFVIINSPLYKNVNQLPFN